MTCNTFSRHSFKQPAKPFAARFISHAVAALALAAASAAHAEGGQFMDAEMPSLGTPVAAVQSTLTRAEVLEAVRTARAANIMSGSGEIVDTPEILQAREDFYALQTTVLLAQAQREQDSQLALLPAQEPAAHAQPTVQEIALMPADADPAATTQGAREMLVQPGTTMADVMDAIAESGTTQPVVLLMVTDDEEAD